MKREVVRFFGIVGRYKELWHGLVELFPWFRARRVVRGMALLFSGVLLGWGGDAKSYYFSAQCINGSYSPFTSLSTVSVNGGSVYTGPPYVIVDWKNVKLTYRCMGDLWDAPVNGGGDPWMLWYGGFKVARMDGVVYGGMWGGHYIYKLPNFPWFGISFSVIDDSGNEHPVNASPGEHQAMPGYWSGLASAYVYPPFSSSHVLKADQMDRVIRIILLRIPHNAPIPSSQSGIKVFRPISIGHNQVAAECAFPTMCSAPPGMTDTYINPEFRYTFNVSSPPPPPPPPPSCVGVPMIIGGGFAPSIGYAILMYNVYKSSIPYVGSTSGLHEFGFEFNNACQNLSKIRYSITSPGGASPNASQGLLYTTKGSSESAYVFQVMRRNTTSSPWQPVSLGTNYDFYTTSASPKISGLLGIRWYRKSGGTTAEGSRTASMRISFTYQ